jgi:hypothetical protein
MIVETVYTYEEWIKHYKIHRRKIFKKKVKRKAITIYNKMVDAIPYMSVIALCVIVYCICGLIAR